MKQAVYDLSRLVAPRDCLGCGAPEAGALCHVCMSGLELAVGRGCRQCFNPNVSDEALTCPWCESLNPAPRQAISMYSYRNAGRAIFHRIKYDGHWRLLRPLLEHRLDVLLKHLALEEYDCMVPIPESFSRKVSRYFNPAAELAKHLSALTGIPIRNHLKLKLWQKRQVGLQKKDRRLNVKNRYQAKGTIPKRILLVDDVATTGSTLQSAQKCLQQSGAMTVGWMTLFRTL